MQTTHPSICRNCLAFCPILVTVQDGRAVDVVGDPQSALYEGYSCPKGRALPAQHNDPNRLLRCLRRGPRGLEPIDSAALAPEIGAKIAALVAEHGPRSIAAYVGTGVVAHPTGAPMMAAFFRALGSPMVFSAATIDKPAANTSTALHGNWIAGAQGFETADVWMLVGANPVISRSNGAPYHNPNARLKEAAARGMKLIVVDPRRTETTRHAALHIQPRPGEDAALLAAMIHVVIAEKLHDGDFLARHAQGFEALAAAVATMTPDWAAARAGVDASQIVEAARLFARGKRGCVVCSTGASFSTRSTLTFYLALCLNTLCGRWAREGDFATYPNIMMPAFTPRAEAYAPYPVFGPQAMRVHGLRQNASGMPTSALADEILTEGEGRVRALFCIGGNPLE
ncbi:MAG: molybdopterin-dependent oxidoreductase, partial [Methylobacteriaceae bacterium]|nr:molybdopterin-dependent oxidoreductase [Methylobacteriaceae bacterium]